MKYNHDLAVAGQPVPVIDSDVRLRYGQPGTATFTVQSPRALSGVVLFTLGINNQQKHVQFFGYIERCTSASSEHQKLFCREKSAVLANRLPVSMRNQTLRDLLGEVARVSALNFSLGKGDYADTPVPFFLNSGSGYHLMHRIGSVFNIPDYLWQQKRDGSIFVGSWQDGHWPGMPITLPDNLFNKQQSNQSAELLAVPGLRPGFILNGKRLKAVQQIDSKMIVSW